MKLDHATEREIRTALTWLESHPDERVFETVPIEWIEVERNVRQRRNEEEDESLTRSIESRGLFQNLVVRVIFTERSECQSDEIENIEEDILKRVRLVLVCGRRRFDSLRAAGETRVPVALGVFSERDALLIGAKENLDRVAMRPWELADLAIELHDDHYMSYKDIADEFNVSAGYLSNLVTCANDLSPRLQKVFRGDQAGSGATLSDLISIAGKYKDPIDQETAWDRLLSDLEFGPKLPDGRTGGGSLPRSNRRRRKSSRSLLHLAGELFTRDEDKPRLAASILRWVANNGTNEQLEKILR